MLQVLEAALRIVAALGAIVVLVGWNAVDLLGAFETGIARFPRGRPVAAHENLFLFTSIVAVKAMTMPLGIAVAWVAVAPFFQSERRNKPPDASS